LNLPGIKVAEIIGLLSPWSRFSVRVGWTKVFGMTQIEIQLQFEPSSADKTL